MSRINIIRGANGLGRFTPSEDGIIGATFGSTLPEGHHIIRTESDVKSLFGVSTSASLGACDNRAFDVLMYLTQKNPGSKIHIWLHDVNMKPSEVFKDETAPAYKLLRAAEGEIRNFFAFHNYDSAVYTPTIADCVDSDLPSAIGNAQLFIDFAWNLHMPLHAFLECVSFTGTYSSALDLRSLEAPGVTVFLGMQKAHAYNPQTNLETVAGLIQRFPVNANLGWVRNGNIQDDISIPAFTNNIAIDSIATADLYVIEQLGYMFFGKQPNYPGVYFNDSASCTALDSDYAYFTEDNVVNKCHRIVYQATMPELNAPIKVDPTSGKIPPDYCKYLESLPKKDLDRMVASGEVSGYDILVDPDQNVLATSNIDIKFEVTPTATGRTYTINLNLKNPFLTT